MNIGLSGISVVIFKYELSNALLAAYILHFCSKNDHCVTPLLTKHTPYQSKQVLKMCFALSSCVRGELASFDRTNLHVMDRPKVEACPVHGKTELEHV
jgi:hypothetical protein